MTDVLGSSGSGFFALPAGWMTVAALVVAGLCLFLAPRLRRWLVKSLDTSRIDLRWALRSLAGQPGLSAVAVISLAIGIAANVTIFSVVDSLLLRALPFEQAEQLLDLHGTVPERGWRTTTLSIPDILDFREQARTIDLAGHEAASFNLAGNGRPERVFGSRVTWNFFTVLQTRPQLGRSFQAEEEQAGAGRVVIISAGLWHRRFAADPGVIGQTLLLDGEPCTVIGVLPASFWFEGRSTEVWTPFCLTGDESRSSRNLLAVARLQGGLSRQQAQAEIAAIAGRLESSYPQTNHGWGAGVRPLRDSVYPTRLRTGGLISAVAVALVLLIACANVANLQLARATDRKREMAVRGALGASRWHLSRQLLTEAMVVATLAGAVGTALSFAGVKGMASLMPAWFPQLTTISVDGRTLFFALVLTTVTGLLFGTLPAIKGARSELVPALKKGGRGIVGPSSGHLANTLVVGEVALALTLLICCALLVQGFSRLQETDWGWSTQNLLSFKVALPENQYGSDQSVIGFYQQLGAELQALPGVEVAGGIDILPLAGESSTYYNVIGQEVAEDERPAISTRMVLPGYFRAMEITMVKGKAITEADQLGQRMVVVINQLLAERHWPGGDPVGQMVQIWREQFEIVGVAANTLDLGHEVRPMAFVPASLLPVRAVSMVLRSSQDPALLTAGVRSTVARLDPKLPIYGVMTVSELMAQENGSYAVMPRLMAGLAIIALLLGLIGVYSVIARSVSRRTQEVGIRMALGARAAHVLGMVMGQGIRLVGIGVVLGLVVAATVTRGLALFLFGVSPFHAVTFGLVAVCLLAAGAVAILIPARRATQLNPILALRHE